MWFKIYSPNVEGVEVVQRRAKRARRARLYYMRCVLVFAVSRRVCTRGCMAMRRLNTNCIIDNPNTISARSETSSVNTFATDRLYDLARLRREGMPTHTRNLTLRANRPTRRVALGTIGAKILQGVPSTKGFHSAEKLDVTKTTHLDL